MLHTTLIMRFAKYPAVINYLIAGILALLGPCSRFAREFDLEVNKSAVDALSSEIGQTQTELRGWSHP
ncbi:hypothetical protein [Bradyrhizobium cenepequi]